MFGLSLLASEGPALKRLYESKRRQIKRLPGTICGLTYGGIGMGIGKHLEIKPTRREEGGTRGWEFVLPHQIRSGNWLIRAHWAKRRAIAKDLETMVWLAARGGQIKAADGFRYIHIQRIGGKELDYDNLVMGCKPLIDAIKRVGLLIDDNPKNLHAVYSQRKAGAGERPGTTRIEIWENVA